MVTTNPEVDAFFSDATKWRKELEQLRSIVLACGLTEELKWRQPCYTYGKSNVVILSGFKDYCAVSFFKGALLRDPKGLLTKPGENTRSVRLIRFTSVREVSGAASVLKAYIREAIKIEKAGLKVDLKNDSELELPDELQDKFDASKKFKSAFESLTPGRQRAYVLHFSAPKQSKTRVSRIEKCTERILSGKGLNDCVCGHSKKMPYCDGSHKHYR